jgi:hypothetical protein
LTALNITTVYLDSSALGLRVDDRDIVHLEGVSLLEQQKEAHLVSPEWL